MPRPTALVAVLTLAACGGSVETTPGGGSGGAGGSGGSGGAPCSSSCEVTIDGWTPTSSLLKPRKGHATFIVETPAGAFLYVAGGGGIEDVERASIHDDGTLGPFSVVASLPGYSNVAGLAQAGRGVILTGSLGSISAPDTYVGVVADDGGIAFTAGPPLTVARHALTASAHGGFVYAIGGEHWTEDEQTQNTIVTYSAVIERASFDGATLGPWVQVDPLPQPIARQAAVVAGDAVYLVGGFANGAPPGPFMAGADVLRAPFGAGDELGAFAWAGAFVAARAEVAAFASSGAVFSLGGMGDQQGADVLRAPLRDDGTLGAFDATTPLPEPRHVRQAPVHGAFVYVAGGSDEAQTAQSTVLVGKLVASPHANGG